MSPYRVLVATKDKVIILTSGLYLDKQTKQKIIYIHQRFDKHIHRGQLSFFDEQLSDKQIAYAKVSKSSATILDAYFPVINESGRGYRLVDSHSLDLGIEDLFILHDCQVAAMLDYTRKNDLIIMKEL